MFLWFKFLVFALVLVDVLIYGEEKTVTPTFSSDEDSPFMNGTTLPFTDTPASISQAPAITTSASIAQPSTQRDCSHINISLSDYAYDANQEVHAKVLTEASDLQTVDCLEKTCHWNETEHTLSGLKECQDYRIQANFTGCTKMKTIHVPPVNRASWNLKEHHTNTSVIFTWNNIKPECKLNFTFHCDPTSGGGKRITEETTRKKFTLNNLSPNKEYNCRSTISFDDKQIFENSSTIKTDFGIPGKPENVTVTPAERNISIQWKKPENEENGPVDGYFISICDKGGKPCPKNNISTTHFTRDTLTPYTNYTVNVWTFTNGQKGELESEKITKEIQTLPARSSKVENPIIRIAERNNIVEITCHKPKEINGPGACYKLIWDDKILQNNSCTFRVPDLSYLTIYTFKVVFWNGKYDSEELELGIKTGYNSSALIIFLAFLIIVTSMALLVVLYKIYVLHQKKSSDSDEPMLPINKDDDKKLMNIDPISAELFWETYRRKMADEGRLFLEEFQSIPRVFSKFTIKDARKTFNQNKNRYVDILPYDYNRVELSALPDVPGSDYINASHIDGFTEPRKYIAAQGPKEETTDDFWRMIWEQKATIVVMVTRCEEGNRVKCAKYWPTMEESSASYGDILVKINSSKVCPDYVIQKLHITNRKEKTSGRDVTHIQFTSWPDHGVPDNPNLLLKLRRRVNALSNFFSGPIVVHCSAGVGRTGTYIGIDAMLEGLEAEGRVDIYGYVVKLRRQRCLMVQVEAQYILIHQALVEYIQYGETEVSISDLHIYLNQLKKRDSSSEPSLLEAEFQRLPSFRNWQTQRAGNKDENKSKNRSSTVIPYDYNRVLFKHEEEGSRDSEHNSSDEDSDDESDSEDPNKYINASFISGYWHPNAMIATQGPLPDTISEFWSMVCQRKVKVIVMLTELEDNNQELCVQYWSEGKQTYDGLTVELKDVNCCSSYTVREFDLTHGKRKETRKVFQYQYHKWQAFSLPESTKDLVAMIQNLKEKLPPPDVAVEASLYNRNVPLVVHCGDGSQQTGLFCALMNLLESAETEGVIDVFQAVKSLRKARPGMVSTFEGYQFLYDTIANVYPAQNGQLPKSQCPKDIADIEKEAKKEEDNNSVTINVCLPVQESSSDASGHEDSKAKNGFREAETSSNGPSNPVLTEIV